MIWDIIAGFFSGAVGAMGLGGGAVLLIYLALFKDTNQLKAQGINLMFFIPVAVISVIIYAIKKQIKWKVVLPLAVSGLIGAGIGFYISGIIGSKIIAKIFGALLCVLGLWQIISAFKKQQNNG